MKIYTRTGDDGSTGLQGGVRVQKSDLRVTAYGTVDELSSLVGWARVAAPSEAIDAVLEGLQETCFRLGAWLSAGPGRDPGVAPISSGDVEVLERAIDRFEDDLPPLNHFVLPGGSELGSRLHVARTTARRAERITVALAEADVVAPAMLQWLNRASDLLFVLARAANRDEGVADVPWRPRAGDGGGSS